MKVTAGNGSSIERKTHMREAGADELGIDRGVMGERRSSCVLIVIKLLCKNMLELEAFNRRSELPKGGRIFQTLAEGRDRFADVACNGVR